MCNLLKKETSFWLKLLKLNELKYLLVEEKNAFNIILQLFCNSKNAFKTHYFTQKFETVLSDALFVKIDFLDFLQHLVRRKWEIYTTIFCNNWAYVYAFSNFSCRFLNPNCFPNLNYNTVHVPL